MSDVVCTHLSLLSTPFCMHMALFHGRAGSSINLDQPVFYADGSILRRYDVAYLAGPLTRSDSPGDLKYGSIKERRKKKEWKSFMEVVAINPTLDPTSLFSAGPLTVRG